MTCNFGIGSRSMIDAGRMAIRKRSSTGFKTQDDYIDRWRLFCLWASGQGVTKMEGINKELVVEYGRHLQQQLEAGEHKSASAPKNYVSAVNCIMKLATHGKWVSVRPGSDCGIQRRNYIPKSSKAMTDSRHMAIQTDIDERIVHLLALQRTFGLRFKESCLLNPKSALKQAQKFGLISVTVGTKGGRPRRIPCGADGLAVLGQAITVQDGKSMVPKSMTYIKFRQQCYTEATAKNFNFHGERHAYAQNRYREITNAPSPLETGWGHRGRITKLAEQLNIPEIEAKELDREARLRIAIELGHSRMEISNAYLG